MLRREHLGSAAIAVGLHYTAAVYAPPPERTSEGERDRPGLVKDEAESRPDRANAAAERSTTRERSYRSSPRQ